MHRKYLIIFGALLALALLGGVALHLSNKTGLLEGKSESAPEEVLVTATTTPNYTIELDQGTDIAALAPNLDRQVRFGESVPEHVRGLLAGKIRELSARLKEDYYRADDWMMLAVLYHSANDFIGARDVWEFLLKVLEPRQTAIVYDNLGKLYKFDLKDFQKSEAYFKASIAANPESLIPYEELFELYRYLYKTDTAAAVDTALKAAQAFPAAAEPYMLLGSYYREKGEYTKARESYLSALERARAAEDVNLVSSVSAELDSLPLQ